MSEKHIPSSDKMFGKVKGMLQKGRTEVKRVGSQSKHQITLRSLKKDRSKMYEKLGKEVEQFILSGDLIHPGLQRGFDRLQQIHTQIKEEE
jgi:hypothetical protein